MGYTNTMSTAATKRTKISTAPAPNDDGPLQVVPTLSFPSDIPLKRIERAVDKVIARYGFEPIPSSLSAASATTKRNG